MKQKTLKKISHKAVKIFKIANRKGYGAVCLNNLTEGSTPNQTYQRMRKAVKRSGYELLDITTEKTAQCIVLKI
ncbi:MAG: hypothetical protein V1747_07365 [Candidatus Omnitrophota bacterium]